MKSIYSYTMDDVNSTALLLHESIMQLGGLIKYIGRYTILLCWRSFFYFFFIKIRCVCVFMFVIIVVKISMVDDVPKYYNFHLVINKQC